MECGSKRSKAMPTVHARRDRPKASHKRNVAAADNKTQRHLHADRRKLPTQSEQRRVNDVVAKKTMSTDVVDEVRQEGTRCLIPTPLCKNARSRDRREERHLGPKSRKTTGRRARRRQRRGWPTALRVWPPDLASSEIGEAFIQIAVAAKPNANMTQSWQLRRDAVRAAALLTGFATIARTSSIDAMFAERPCGESSPTIVYPEAGRRLPRHLNYAHSKRHLLRLQSSSTEIRKASVRAYKL